jgi:hypothetical protein
MGSSLGGLGRLLGFPVHRHHPASPGDPSLSECGSMDCPDKPGNDGGTEFGRTCQSPPSENVPWGGNERGPPNPPAYPSYPPAKIPWHHPPIIWNTDGAAATGVRMPAGGVGVAPCSGMRRRISGREGYGHLLGSRCCLPTKARRPEASCASYLFTHEANLVSGSVRLTRQPQHRRRFRAPYTKAQPRISLSRPAALGIPPATIRNPRERDPT